jgi:protein CpxP
MNSPKQKIRYLITMSAALIVGGALIAAPVTGNAEEPAPINAPMQTVAAPTQAQDPVERVEARITDLHAKLQITPAQEDLWKNVTQEMRDKAKTIDGLQRARFEKATTMTAVEDFKSYGEIADAHADGIKKFIPVFAALYNSMSDDQKKNADTIFRSRMELNNTTSKSN